MMPVSEIAAMSLVNTIVYSGLPLAGILGFHHHRRQSSILQQTFEAG